MVYLINLTLPWRIAILFYESSVRKPSICHFTCKHCKLHSRVVCCSKVWLWMIFHFFASIPCPGINHISMSGEFLFFLFLRECKLLTIAHTRCYTWYTIIAYLLWLSHVMQKPALKYLLSLYQSTTCHSTALESLNLLVDYLVITLNVLYSVPQLLLSFWHGNVNYIKGLFYHVTTQLLKMI